MGRIVHLSDLHFGRTNADLLEPLVEAVNGVGADIVAISGDLTQRARASQFREACALIERLEAPCLMTPGNHDTPLDHLPIRLFDPYRRWRRWTGVPLDDAAHIDGATLACLNTVSPLDWQRGRISRRAVRKTCRALQGGREGDIRVVVAHHPFEHVIGAGKSPMRRARMGLSHLLDCEADIVLCGHLHTYGANPTKPLGDRSLIQVMAGTSLSSRLRGELNNFNVLDLDRDRIEIRQFSPDADLVYGQRHALTFRREGRRWAASPAPRQRSRRQAAR